MHPLINLSTHQLATSLSYVRTLSDSLLELLFPRNCCGCGTRLAKDERFVCPKCMIRLSREKDYDWQTNPRILLWREHEALQKVGAFTRYHRKGVTANIIHQLKYYRHYELGAWMGRMAAQELAGTGLFDGVEVLVPLPLTSRRQHWRGFNQSEEITKGMAERLGIEVRTDILKRVVERTSQTHFTLEQRKSHLGQVFSLENAEALTGRHAMLVDDVMTTGATMLAAIEAIEQTREIKLSAFAWAWTPLATSSLATTLEEA